jgi:hypothetical protein
MPFADNQGGFSMSVVYALYDALVSINVPDDKAKAVIDAMEREMMDKLATKADLAALRSEMGSEFKLVRQEVSSRSDLLSKDIQSLEARLDHTMSLLGSTLTIKLGGLMVVLLGLLYTLLRIP